MPTDTDPKVEQCVSFILDQFKKHNSGTRDAGGHSLVVGINGAQGCGKTTLVSAVAEALNGPPHSIPTLTCSIDQFYLSRPAQIELASNHPSNSLVQHRGQPSTHDLPLAIEVLSNLRNGTQTRVPYFDKSAFDGKGDRAPREQWQLSNAPQQTRVKIIIIEGWCVGFRALSESDLKRKWEEAILRRAHGEYVGRLAFCKLSDISLVNTALIGYDQLTDQFDSIIHLDAEDPQYVYEWRLEQEKNLRKNRGSGMTDDQVHQFVDGYYPAYELYTQGLREGGSLARVQLRLVLGSDRRVKDAVHL